MDPGWLRDWNPVPFPLDDAVTGLVAMGEGPSLLLLPPLPGFKESFLGLAPLLARRFRVITFDLPVRSSGEPSWEGLLRDLERIADACAPGPAVVMGHSLGGALAQRWALLRPERVAALVLSSSFAHVGTAPGQWVKRYLEQPLVLLALRCLPDAAGRPLARRLADHGRWVLDPRCNDRLLDFLRFAIRHVPVGLARRCVRLALAHDTRPELGALRGPVLVVRGERETPWARAASAELQRLLPQAEARISPGVSHLHPLSAPEWLAGTVGPWAARHVGALGSR